MEWLRRAESVPWERQCVREVGKVLWDHVQTLAEDHPDREPLTHLAHHCMWNTGHWADEPTKRFSNLASLPARGGGSPEDKRVLERVAAQATDSRVCAPALDLLFHLSSGRDSFDAGRHAVPALLALARELSQRVGWSPLMDDSIRRAAQIGAALNSSDLVQDVWAELALLIGEPTADEDAHRWHFDVARIVVDHLPLADRHDIDTEDALRALTSTLPALAEFYRQEDKTELALGSRALLASIHEHLGDPVPARKWEIAQVDLLEQIAERRRAPGKPTSGAMVASHFLQRALARLKSIRSRHDAPELKDRSDRLKRRIVEMNEAAKEEMTPISVEERIDLGPYREMVDWIVGGIDQRDRVMRLLHRTYIPDLDALRQQVGEQLEEYVFWRILPQQALVDGRPVGVRDEQSYPEAEMNRQILWTIDLCIDLVVQPAISRMQDEGLLSAPELSAIFVASGLIDEARVPLFERGIQAIFDDHPEEAVHLLVPQLEASLRRLVQAAGGSVLRETNGIMTVALLEPLLAEAAVLGEPGVVRVLRLILSAEGEGHNLRNRVCHGLIRADECGARGTMLVLYCLLQLLRWKVSPKEGDEPMADTDSSDDPTP